MRAPVLSGPRLELRPLGRGDLGAVHRHWTEPEVRRFLWDGRVVSGDEVEEAIRTSERLFREHGVGLWRLCPHGSTDLLGCAGFWFFHDPPQLELLFSLSASHWGRGLAREAASALIDYAFDDLGWELVQASADTPNVSSLRLIRALGMQPIGSVPGEFGTIDVYRVSRRQWRQSRGSPAAH